jgi:hypothetical protein
VLPHESATQDHVAGHRIEGHGVRVTWGRVVSEPSKNESTARKSTCILHT